MVSESEVLILSVSESLSEVSENLVSESKSASGHGLGDEIVSEVISVSIDLFFVWFTCYRVIKINILS